MSLYRQFIGYFINGLCATFVHYSILVTLVEFDLLIPDFATIIGFICGTITGFLLNRYLVFNHSQSNHIAFLKYLTVAITSMGLNSATMYLLMHYLGLHYMIAQVIATGSIIIWNFSCYKFWVFKELSDEK